MRASVLVVVVALVAAGCAGEEQAARSPSPASSPSPGLAQTCDAPRQGYRVGYPEGWSVNDPEAASPCSWFHPEPFELPQHTEVTEIAITLDLEDGGFEQLSEATSSGPDVAELVSQDDTTVAGRRAVRVEKVTSGEVFYPEGTRVTTYTVDWDGRTMIASTTSVASGDYERHVEVLDRMMDGLQRLDVEAACSASAMSADLPDQPELPAAVAETRRRIAEAAVACDYQRLAELAAASDGTFTYSFGDTGDPAAFWERQEGEAQGPEPMKFLVGMLKRPFATQDPDAGQRYVWPSAYGYGTWSEVPQAARDALRPLYTDVEMQRFERFGSYIGYRVGIDADGGWRFFVAGD